MSESLLIVFAGPRGSGKSLSATVLCVLYMMSGGQVTANVRIRVGDDWDWPEDAPRESEKLDPAALGTMDPSYFNRLVFVDEAQNILSNQEWHNGIQKLISLVAAQSRKISLSLIMTVMNPAWINRRVLTLVDVIIYCHDLARTNWGRENEIEKGRFIQWNVYDRTGILTGELPEKWEGSYVGSKVIRTEPFWSFYDTFELQDVFAAFDKVSIKGREVTIALPGSKAAAQADEPPIEAWIEPEGGEELAEIPDSQMARLMASQAKAR